ncbi:MAG: PA0069 family radical SAM protein [Gammaproteobacteria bacterium]|nr:PA0069 family radical SAM protein [Gammaproteobacteria bacterium]
MTDRPRKGRGATCNPANRYAATRHEAVDDGWGSLDAPLPPLPTTVGIDTARSIITYNDSPDIPIDRSINPYRGCEHGCIYCYARPSHARCDLSPGLDFETRLFCKPDAAPLLRKELAARGYCPATVGIGVNTDAYQPIERTHRITRSLLEVLAEARHPVSLITKSSLIERDMDLLAPMAARGLVEVAISITTLDTELARRLEPRASRAERRLETIARLSAAGIPVSILVAPVIPVLTDAEMEGLLEKGRAAGAVDAGYQMLRLPLELKALFEGWLEAHYPDSATHVLARLREFHGGREYDSGFGRRMRGSGIYAELMRKRFKVAYERLAFPGAPPLETGLFTAPALDGQIGLF